MRKTLVTGALGQIGCELVAALTHASGAELVIASDVRARPMSSGSEPKYEHLDCTEPDQLHDVVRRHNVGTIYHLAALLSAVAEDKPQAAWDVNMASLINVLETARQHDCAVLATGLNYPVVPKGDEEIRFQISADHTQADINEVLGVLESFTP